MPHSPKSTVHTSKSSQLLTSDVVKQILNEHSIPHFVCNGKLYGVMPFLDAKTLEKGFDITDLTGFSILQLKEYLGY